MADNVAITAGSGTSIAADDIASVFHQRVKISLGADGSATDALGGAGAVASGVQRVTLASDDPAVTALAALQATGWQSIVSITRPADTTAYAANDALSDSTSSPTSGGFTVSGAARASGGYGVIEKITAFSTNDPATLAQIEVWLFDQSVTNVNDNSAFALTDGDGVNYVAHVPLAFITTVAGSGTNSVAVADVWIPYKCSGSANLRFLVKVKNAYTPANSEVFTFKFNGQWRS
jgi:hypothetical protein